MAKTGALALRSVGSILFVLASASCGNGGEAAGGGGAGGSGASSATTGTGGENSTGGAASVTGGAASVTGGATNVSGGAASMTGGRSNPTGGAISVTGGAPDTSGGAASAKGGAANATGGSASAKGGTANATAGKGGAGNVGGQTSSGGVAGGSSSGVQLGIYCGNDPAAIQQFETWLGRPVDGILGYTGAADWTDYDGSVGWAVGLWGSLDRAVFWSVPLIPKGATLEEAAKGSYDDHYRKAAEKLAAYRPQDKEVQIRTGWELNGDWFPWAAQGKEQAFIGAYQHFVTTFRSVATRFVFEWNVNIGNNTEDAMNPETAYPGDDYVDIVGMDFYWNTAWDPADPSQAWQSMVKRKYGLDWHQSFAATHHKRTSYSEWGIMSNQAGPYIEQAESWFESHAVVFHSYWNSDSDFKGKLSSNQYPAAGTAYRTAFGSH